MELFAALPTLEFDNKYLDLISIHAGKTLKIPVSVVGVPCPEITWASEDGQLQSCDRINISVRDALTTLTVRDVVREDDGLLTLIASNEIGKARAIFDVEVLGKCYLCKSAW